MYIKLLGKHPAHNKHSVRMSYIQKLEALREQLCKPQGYRAVTAVTRTHTALLKVFPSSPSQAATFVKCRITGLNVTAMSNYFQSF